MKKYTRNTMFSLNSKKLTTYSGQQLLFFPYDIVDIKKTEQYTMLNRT